MILGLIFVGALLYMMAAVVSVFIEIVRGARSMLEYADDEEGT